MKLLLMYSLSGWLHCYTDFSMIHPCHFNQPYVANHLPDSCCIIIKVNQCPFHIIAELHTRCDTTGSNDCTHNQTSLLTAHHCRMSKFTDWDCYWVFFTKVLLYLSFYSDFFYCLCIFKYHHHHSTNALWAGFHTNCSCQKFS